MTDFGTAQKKEVYSKHEVPEKGKLIISRRLQGQIDYLHDKVGAFEWIGILLYKKLEGNITNPGSLEILAEKLFLMDIGTTAHTQATIDSEEVLNMYDKVTDIMELKQGLIHTHHTMDTFFSGEDWSELNDNTPLHNYYLSLIVNFKGAYTAKVAYMADLNNIFKFKDCNDDEVISESTKKVLVTMNMEIYKEGEGVDQDFIDRHEEVKKAKVKPTVYTGYGTMVDAGPYHSWKERSYEAPKKDQGEVDQEETFRTEESRYYRTPADSLTYNQAKQICLDWLNEGLRNEGVTRNNAFTSIVEGLTWFENLYEDRFQTAAYRAFELMMQKLLVEVSTDYQPQITSKRVEVLMKEFMYGSGTKRIASALAEISKAHPQYLIIMRKQSKHEHKKNKKNNGNRQSNIWP